MHFHRTTRISMLLTGVAALALPVAAYAEDAAKDNSEIIVTATRDARSLQAVPMSVNVTTGEELRKQQILDVKDISRLAPGLELTNTSGRNNTTSLRGMSFDPDQGTSPTVQVYLNEVPTDAQTVYTAIYDIGQIEVLRGPQGLLRGATAPAGSITIATARPKFDGKVDGYATATATDRHAYNFQGAVTVPINNMLAIRVAGLADGNRLNQVQNVNRGNDYSKSRTESGRITLGFKPNEDFTAYLTYQYLSQRINQYQQVVGAGNTPVSVYSEIFGTPKIFMPASFGGGPFAVNTAVRSGPAIAASDYLAVSEGVYTVNLRSSIINLGFDWDLGPVKLSFVGAHQRDLIKTNRDQDVGNAVPGYIRNNYVEVSYPVDVQELRLTTTNPEGFGGGIGVYHLKQGGYAINDVPNDLFWYATDPNGGPVLANLGTGFFPTTNKVPLFVHVMVPIQTETISFNANLHYYSGPLKIDGGIRYSERKNNQTTQLSATASGSALIPNIGGPGVNLPISAIFSQPLHEIIPAALQKSKVKPVTGGLTISYEVDPTTNVYFAYGHSFRGRTTGVSTPAGITSDLIQTKDEKTDSFEVGIKGSLMDRKLHYTVSAFYQKFNGYIGRFDGIYWVSAADPSGKGFFSFNYNGDASIKGIEASLNGRVTDNWDFGINMAYSHGRYSNAKLPCNDFAGTGTPNQTGTAKVTGTGNVSYCVSNGRMAEVPDFSMNASTEVRFPMGSVTPYIGAQFAYRPGFVSEKAGFNYQDRELLNLFVGVRGEDNKWELGAFAKNMLNQKRITNISLGNQQIGALISGTYDSGYRTINAMNPREFGLSGTVRF